MAVYFIFKIILLTHIHLIVFFKATEHQIKVVQYILGKIQLIQTLHTVFSKKMWQAMVEQYQL